MITFPHIGYIGRLGNQLFQYSALFSISKKHNCDVFLLNSNLELYKCFKLKTKISPYYNKDFICTHGLENDIITDYNTIFLTENNQYDKLLNTNFDHNFYNTNHDKKSIFGFFQNYKYFLNYENQLRIELKFRERYNRICNLYLGQKYSGDQLLSIHIRRTDYLDSSVLNNLDLFYYENALTYFDESLPVLVFSDDPEWCQDQTLFGDGRFTIIKTNNTYIDLCLMSKCDYHIIANSSFSWWGSWLAQSKTTICPKQWFSENYNFLDSDGLRLPHWISI